MRLVCLLAGVILAIIGAPALAHAGPPADMPHGLLRFRSFGSAEGLHNLVVFSIAQDASGSLWIGTDDGVARYDGERFTHLGVADGLLSTVLLVIGVAPDGNVCVGGHTGLVCWDGTRFSHDGGAGLPDAAVHAVVSASGRLWVGTTRGLYVRGAEGGFQPAPGWPTTAMVKALWADERGIIAGDGGRVLTSTGDGTWRELSTIGLAGDRVDAVLRDRAGAVWIRTALHMWRLSPGDARAEDLVDGMPSGYDNVSSPGSMVNGPHGEVLFGSDVGIVVREGNHWRVIGRDAGLPSLGARTLFVDRDGSTWVGSVGLFQLRGRGLLERYDLSNGLPGDLAWSIGRDRDGVMWVGTNRCLARMLNSRWECLPGTEKRIVRSFAFPPQGGVFLGGAPSDLLYVDPSGHVISLGDELDHPADHAILSVRIGPEGDLWVATKIGLYRLPGAVPGALERVIVPGIAPDAKYNTLLVADGRLWVASTEGIAVRDRGTWHVFGTAHGFRAQGMRYMTRTHGREICLAYVEAIGVTCFEVDGVTVSKLRHIGVADGMITGSVYFLGADRQRRLWIGTGDGVDVVTPRGIDHFGEADGLAGADSTANAFFMDADGSLWLGSTGGITHVQAQRYDGPPPPPRVMLRAGQLGDHSILRAGLLETPHDRNALKLEFGTDRLIDAARIEYQVRLSPLEPKWSATRMREARYPSLFAGTYQFEVRARIGTGEWGPVTALGFTVQPAWWRSAWFLAAAGLAILLAIVAVFAWMYRRVLRRRTRQLAERSEASVRALLEFVPDLISVHRNGKVIYSNRAARRMYGLVGDGEREDLGDRIHPDDRARVAELMSARASKRPDAGHEPELLELRVRDDDGTWRVCEVSGVWTELAGATVLVASGRDVTERRQLRAQLLVSDRMASLGTLAAGIAHEINNPLAYVLGNLEVMAETLAGPEQRLDQLATAIGDATDGAQRVRKIVQGLRSFSRSEEEKRVPLELADVLGAAIRLTTNEVRHRAQLVCELGPTPKVIADDGRLTQVFINLIVNAAHAIPEGRSDDNRVTVRTQTDDLGRAVIEIVDTGRGMPPEVQARAFDPFYTTKGVGSGTGLGLSICHGIVSALGGHITIDSALGKGTVMRVVLPPAALPELVVAPAVVPELPPPPTRPRVLVVDDEPLVAEMLERVLRRDHDVVAVSCGRDALAQISSGAWFDAIVSDVMMPNMTGIELLEALVEVAPEQAKRLIFLSGGVFTPETRSRLDELGTLQLEKPINTKDLRSSVMSIATAPSGRYARGSEVRNPDTSSSPSSAAAATDIKRSGIAS